MQAHKTIHKGMCVAVMGLGITGQAAVRFCLDCGADVRVSDSRDPERFEREAADFLRENSVLWEAGGHTFDFLRLADLVIISPGIPEEHEVVSQLRESGIEVVGELAVAAPLLDMPVVAVTGTNGKTTVTSLIGEICKTAGKKVFVGGNIGTPLFDYLRQEKKADVAILEVSSFQLMMAGGFAPDVSVLLNITPDHIDRHKNLDGYAAAKMLIFSNQTAEHVAVVCNDDPECMKRIESVKPEVQTFGKRPGSLAKIEGLRVTVTRNSSQSTYDFSGTSLATSIGVLNGAAAILACERLGITQENIQRGITAFQPPPHRMQVVGDLDGVTYINDSKATNTGAVIAALEHLNGKTVLIAGGRDKGEDYSLLTGAVGAKAREVIVIGEAAEAIRQSLEGSIAVKSADSMQAAVRLAKSIAQPGDTVLLSPACASFDMFKSYGHRGEVFTSAVKEMIAENESLIQGQG
ncbi:UDP-N-acetylmuramoyl-L-alanine--D-glutamate ligase [Desulfosediminicola flagellatus]|uniref:UDP-N-acetylmuramoyl-L-alanine--D-glutamate ligase n=1 Tax=Desulfosediminicola flagellatus TaxID=2569541 RepID=UPI0010AC43D7|nr:UDP-N-acetylmuramoyl-L-alanine--D-glutamate ligase [Desulfosediminicola flagellatus]